MSNIQMEGSGRAGECVKEYIEAVNAGEPDRAYNVLKNAEVRVPHGVTAQQTMRGDEVKEWLEHRIKQQHVKVEPASPIKVEGDTARAEVYTTGDMIPSSDFPKGFCSVITAKVGSDGSLTQFHAEPKDPSEWNRLAEKRRQQKA